MSMDWYKINEALKKDIDYDYCYWRKQQVARRLTEEDIKCDIVRRSRKKQGEKKAHPSVKKISYNRGEQQQSSPEYV
jgi:hypothetical protein